MSTPWSNLKERPITRKDFLKLTGIGLLVVANLEGVIKLITGRSLVSGPKNVDVGYGSEGYSGFISKSNSKQKSS